jgi:hypothetical protein
MILDFENENNNNNQKWNEQTKAMSVLCAGTSIH